MRSVAPLIYVFSLLIFEITGELILTNNIILFSLSALFNFIFIFSFFRINNFKYLIFSIPIIHLVTIIILPNVIEEHSNDIRLFYNFLILLMAILIVKRILLNEKNLKIKSIIFPFIVVFFFSLDFFLGIPFDFLTQQSLEVVAFFWFLRAIALQCFYISIIYFSLKKYQIQ